MDREQFNEKLEAVAGILGLTWKPRPDSWNNSGHLQGSDEVSIWVGDRVNGGYGKISFSGSYPRDNRGGWGSDNRVEIGVAETKTAEQIAKDIQRRLLPEYLKNLVIIQGQITRANEYEAKRVTNIRLVADHFGWELSGERHDMIWPTGIEEIYRIEALNDSQVKFKIECGPEIAIRILELLEEGKR